MNWSFLRHYLEMLVAMAVGMAALMPLWELAAGDRPDASWVNRAEVESLVMATAMAVPMALWMRFRRHRLAPIVEMSLAMYAGFVTLFPLLWLGVLDAGGVMMIGHVLMLVLMLAAMLARYREYSHAHPRGASCAA
ncbi:hypothetical protein [Nocardioides speluncae]|uniref:hypothetical protein n=1 Tax=Nocardioides speluncae TaxID=2670337 RepID=UPI000D68D673|nr:hypothetical protein [Nocardioides speluncae]